MILSRVGVKGDQLVSVDPGHRKRKYRRLLWRTWPWTATVQRILVIINTHRTARKEVIRMAIQ